MTGNGASGPSKGIRFAAWHLPNAILSAVVGAFYFSIWHYSANFPSSDDYDAILNVLNAHGWDRWKALWAQHNEHRILFCKLVAWAYWGLFGPVDFRVLNLIGNLSLVGIFLLLERTAAPTTGNRAWLRVPLALLLFSFGFWGTSFMAMASLSNLWVLWMALAAIHYLASGRFYAALLFSLVASFTSGGGMPVFAAGAALLACGKKYRPLVVWLPAAGLALTLYLYHYVQPPQHPFWESTAEHPIRSVLFLLLLLGSHLGGLLILVFPQENTSGLLGGMVLGLFLVAHFAYLTVKKYHQANPRLYFFMAYLLVAGFTVDVSRSGFGLFAALNSRYLILSVLFLACVYLSLADLKYFESKGRVLGAVLVCLAVNWGWFYLFWGQAGNGFITTRLFRQQARSSQGIVQLDFPDQSKAWQILAEAKKNGIYDIDKELADRR